MEAYTAERIRNNFIRLVHVCAELVRLKSQ